MSAQTWIEGERDDGVAQRVTQEAAALRDVELDAQLDRERVLIDLLNEEDPEQLMDRYQRNLHVHCGLDWNEYRADPPHSLAQRMMAKIREGLHRLLRPALEWLTFRQSAVNSQLTSLLIDERNSRLATEVRLQAEIDVLRTALGQRDPSPDGENR